MRNTITLPGEPAGQHRLIDAVIAVNEASTLVGAFQVLAETALELLGADQLAVIVWSDDLTVGEVAAAAGPVCALLGELIPSDAHSIESISTGEHYAGPPILDGLSPELRAAFGNVSTVVRVPLLTASCRATFHAAWDTPLSGAEASEAARLLHTLSRLTTLAERTLRERERARDRNQLNQEMLKALFDAIPTAIAVAHPETREIVAVNRAFCQLVGRPADELIGLRPPFPWWAEDDDDDGEQRFAPGTSSDRIYRRADGRPLPAHLSVHSIPGDDGEPALILALIEDLAEERRLQQQLVQSGKLAAIGELAAGVAHEINNPLFAILGLTEFLLKEAEVGSKAHTRLELIQQTGLEIKEIVRALLDFARENAEERRVVSLEDVVHSTVELVRRTNAHKGVELIDDYEGADVFVNASTNQLKQIVLNLIANARQAMPNGGTVTVDVRREGELASVTVTDNGPGLDPAVADRIFEPFFTTKRLTGGTGLGLSVSLGIAEAHGGRLTVASEPGAGATFTLYLPLAGNGAP